MIRNAHINDLAQIMLIVEQTIDNMKTWENRQWDSKYPTTESFKLDISNNSLFVYEKNDKIIAFITIDQYDPPAYFGLNWRSKEPHLVFHRFAVHNDYKGHGFAFELLSFGQAFALKSQIQYIRIDTNSKNIPMNSLLTKFGFIEIDRVKFRNVPDEFICYDKILTTCNDLLINK